MSIGEKIRRARQINGYTQAQLAAKIGCSVNTIARWEHDRNMPSKRDVDKLSSILDIDLENDECVFQVSNELNLEDIKLELSSSQKNNKKLIIIMILIIVLFVMAFIIYGLCIQWRDSSATETPVKIIYYDVSEGEEIR